MFARVRPNASRVACSRTEAVPRAEQDTASPWVKLIGKPPILPSRKETPIQTPVKRCFRVRRS